MNLQRVCPGRTVAATLIAATMTIFAAPSQAITTARTSTKSNSASSELSSDKPVHLAQVTGGCRQVVAQSGLNVRAEPGVYGAVRGVISYGRTVTIEPGSSGDWVRISAPMAGYVYANWLGNCETAVATPSLDNCRLIIGEQGLPIRQSPSTDAAIVGRVSSGRRVTIVNRGANGWVPIAVPFKGYVPASNLYQCQENRYRRSPRVY